MAVLLACKPACRITALCLRHVTMVQEREGGGGGMGALFAKKKVVWVPENEKLEDKCSYPDGWAAVESFRGWKVRVPS